MSVVRFRLLVLAVFSLIVVDRAPSRVVVTGDIPSRTSPTNPPASRPAIPGSLPTMAKLPVRFEANAGQFDERVRFVARRSGGSLFLEEDRATLVVQTKGADKPTRHRSITNANANADVHANAN